MSPLAATLWFGEGLPGGTASALVDLLQARWPEVSWQVAPARHDAGVFSEPVLAVLAPGDAAPPADPAELGVVWWPSAGAVDGEVPPAVAASLRAQAGRLLAVRQGLPPARAQALPTRVSRAELLRVPRARPLPLRAIPRIDAAPCVHPRGCTLCTAECPAAAITFETGAGGPRIDPAACTECGACVAACPTGSLQSASCADQQWQGTVAETADDPAAAPITVSCALDQEAPRRVGTRVEVACLGELGWSPLAALAVNGLVDQVQLVCADRSCPRRPAAARAEDRWQRIRELVEPSTPDGSSGETTAGVGPDRRPTPASPVSNRAWRWPATIGALRGATRSTPVEILRRPADPPLGYRVRVEPTAAETCTLCEGCVNVCPTRALHVDKDPRTTLRRLRWDAARCIGCDACVPACGTHVLRVEPDRSATALWADEPLTLFEDEVLRCAGCGIPLESAAFVMHITTTLRARGFGDDELGHLLYCQVCKDRQLFAGR